MDAAVSLFRKKPPPKPIYAFSESVWASTTSPWHISPVVNGELKLGGGAPAPLCGLAWMNGWHIAPGLDPETGLLLTSWVDGGAPQFVCLGCAARWYERS